MSEIEIIRLLRCWMATCQNESSLAHDCRTCESWTNDRAKSWWEKHLIELTGPLAVLGATPEPTGHSLAIH